ncbi:MAG: hypothetical protein ACPG7F_17295, partial [Aggregatilineales bacterium]
MSIDVTWDTDAKTVLMVSYEKPWTWDEFNQAIDDVQMLLDSVNHPVHMIFDIRGAGFPPQGAMQRFRRTTQINHPNVDLLIYIAPSMLARFIGTINTILGTVYDKAYSEPDFHFVKT